MSEQQEPVRWAELSTEQRDRLVCEKVFGYKLTPATLRFLPSYTTSMDAAWMVVEHMKQLPQTIGSPREMAGTWFIGWWKTVHLWEMSKEEAASAICVAALDVCGIKIEEK